MNGKINELLNILSVVFDASVKSPVGVEYGVEYQFGNFDQCMEISTSLENGGVNIEPKYCLVDVTLDGYAVQKAAVRNQQVSCVALNEFCDGLI